MKRYSVTQVRERLSEALDLAEAGEPVVIERRGIVYQLTTGQPTGRRDRRHRPQIEILDDAVADGQWEWTWTPEGLAFKGRPKPS